MSHCQPADVTVEYRGLPGIGRRKQLYRVGSDGSIWSLSAKAGAVWKQLKPSVDRWGYMKVKVFGVRQSVHRLILEAFYGPPADPAMFGRHIDDNKANNTRDNLRWGFPADNVGDAFANSRMWVGSRLHCAKIDEDGARSIVADFRAGFSRAELARRHRLSLQSVCNILNGHTWAHVTGIPYDPQSRARRLTPVPTVHPATPTS